MPRMSEFIQNQKDLMFNESPTNSNGRDKIGNIRDPIDFGDGSEVVP